MHYRNTMLKLFRSLNPQEICMKLIFVFVHDLYENTQDYSQSSNEGDEFQDCQVWNLTNLTITVHDMMQ